MANDSRSRVFWPKGFYLLFSRLARYIYLGYKLLSHHVNLLQVKTCIHREESPSLDRNFRNPFTEIPERLPV